MNKGTKHTDAAKLKMSKKRLSEEHKRKIGEAQLGENNHNYGKKHSDETKRKMSEAHKGEKNHNYGKPMSDEQKLKISESKKGQKQSEEAKLKKSKALKGRKFSDETLLKRSGDKHHNWKGGISFAPYCPKFNNEFKEEIREMFDRKCFMCGISENEAVEKLSIHHVNYGKECLCDDIECKFVPLCRSCHSKTNYNRDYWEKHIMNKLNNVSAIP